MDAKSRICPMSFKLVLPVLKPGYLRCASVDLIQCKALLSFCGSVRVAEGATSQGDDVCNP